MSGFFRKRDARTGYISHTELYSKSIIQDANLQPASVGLSRFLGPNSSDWNSIMAYAAIYVTPILAAFVILQRRIVAGLTSGALK